MGCRSIRRELTNTTTRGDPARPGRATLQGRRLSGARQKPPYRKWQVTRPWPPGDLWTPLKASRWLGARGRSTPARRATACDRAHLRQLARQGFALCVAPGAGSAVPARPRQHQLWLLERGFRTAPSSRAFPGWKGRADARRHLRRLDPPGLRQRRLCVAPAPALRYQHGHANTSYGYWSGVFVRLRPAGRFRAGRRTRFTGR